MTFVYTTCIEIKFFILDYSFILVEITDISVRFYFDFLSNLFLLIVRLIRITTFFYRKFYIDLDKNKNKFLVLTLTFVLSINIVILSLNFFIILIGWDCLGVISYFLVIHYNSDNRDYSGIVTLITNRIGDISIIFCIYISFSLFRSDIFLLNLDNCFFLFLLLIRVSGFTKRAQFPFRV